MRHNGQHRPTFLFTLVAIIIPLVCYVVHIPARPSSMQSLKSSLMPFHKESPTIFSCEVTLFAHGLHLIAHTLLLEQELPQVASM